MSCILGCLSSKWVECGNFTVFALFTFYQPRFAMFNVILLSEWLQMLQNAERILTTTVDGIFYRSIHQCFPFFRRKYHQGHHSISCHAVFALQLEWNSFIVYSRTELIYVMISTLDAWKKIEKNPKNSKQFLNYSIIFWYVI